MDTLDQSAIQRGHHELVATFREFMQTLTLAVDPPDVEGLRGVVAFLRQSVLGFAHREEESLRAAGQSREDTALEHAFLAAEIDRLAQEIDRLLGIRARPGADAAGCLARIRRLAYRIEAVLELHMLKDEECAVSVPAAEPEERPGTGTATMSPAEVDRFLRGHRWGMLGTVGDGRPYAVPVSYAFDGEHFYVATAPGRKARNLDQCAAVCFTVAEVDGADRWRCVVATGEARWIEDLPGRLRALRLLARHRPGGLTAKDLARAARARVLRFAPDELTGRAQG